jgi:hypothetical protein
MDMGGWVGRTALTLSRVSLQKDSSIERWVQLLGIRARKGLDSHDMFR